MNYDAALLFAKDLAKQAGTIMLEYFRSTELNTHLKSDDSPVTEADLKINNLVIESVKVRFPAHGVLGEEVSFEPENDEIWVVDPIDGTLPFSLGMPVSTFSLALVNRKDGQPVVAVTYDPWLDELYSASKSGGAFLNDKPIHTSTQQNLKRGCIAASSRPLEYEDVSYRAGHFNDAARAAGARSIGFASFVYTSNRVANGQLLGTVVGEAGAWDIAASSLLIQEAGGVVTDLKGNSRRFDEAGLGCVQAANTHIHDEIMGLLKK